LEVIDERPTSLAEVVAGQTDVAQRDGLVEALPEGVIQERGRLKSSDGLRERVSVPLLIEFSRPRV
jgi:putative heme iron utilization protein